MSSGTVGRITLFVLAGLAAGLLTWFVSDGSGLIRLSNNTAVLSAGEARAYQIIFLTWGGSIGVLLGLADILASGQTGNWLRVVGVGLGIGMAAGVLGGAFGMYLYGPIHVATANTPFDFLRNVLARALGFALIGALAGTATGWQKLSFRVGRNGFIGGLIGGLIGGASFEMLPYLMPGIAAGSACRVLAFAIMGALIGLFIALVQQLFKEAWVRVVVGRNEGKEILIERSETRIGRAELSEISLFGDPNIARTHGLITAQPGGGYVLQDVSKTPIGIRVNDNPIDGQQMLHSGDRIQIGSRLLVFYERYTRTRTAPAPRDQSQRSPLPPLTGPALGMPSNGTNGNGYTMPPAPQPVQTNYATLGQTTVPGARRTGREISAEAHLVATSGPYTGTVFPVRNGATIGRDAAAEIALPADIKASRTHARLIQESGSFLIEDCNSTNGIYVNGQRVTRQPLVQGDTIIVGTSAFRYE